MQALLCKTQAAGFVAHASMASIEGTILHPRKVVACGERQLCKLYRFSHTSDRPSRQRHQQILAEVQATLTRAIDAEARGLELAAEDLRLAGRALGRLTGAVDVEALLDIVFADFCIGK